MNFKRTVVWILGALLAVPLIVIAVFFGYLLYQSWAAIKTVPADTFGDGEILEITRKASGPIGSGYANECSVLTESYLSSRRFKRRL